MMEKIHREKTLQVVRERVSAKPTLGKPLNKFQFTFEYMDGSATQFDGETSDVTGLFIGKGIQKDTLRVLMEGAKRMGIEIGEDDVASAVPDTDPPTSMAAIKAAILDLKAFDLQKVVRVLLLEESINHQKHLILQIRHLNLLTEYASNLDSAQWSFVRGLKFDYLVRGKASSLPHAKKLKDLGEVFIHTFIPKKAGEEDQNDDLTALEHAKVLMALIPIMPQVVSNDQTLKAKDEEIKGIEDELKKLRQDYGEKATGNMAAKTAVAGLEGEGEMPETMKKEFSGLDYLAVLGGVLGLGYFLSTITPLGWPIGSAIGAMLGLVFVSWRR